MTKFQEQLVKELRRAELINRVKEEDKKVNKKRRTMKFKVRDIKNE